MAKIPFNFVAIPKYLFEKGYIKDRKAFIFISWCFSKISYEKKIIYHDHQEIELDVHRFIFGRNKCSEETGLTDDEIRTQQKNWEKLLIVKKCPNKTPNRFTIYELMTDHFCESNTQQNPRQTPNKPPTNPHKQDLEIKDLKETTPKPPNLGAVVVSSEFKKLFEILKEHSQQDKNDVNDETIKRFSKKPYELIRLAIEFIMHSDITDSFCKTISWFIKQEPLPKANGRTSTPEENRKYAMKRIQETNGKLMFQITLCLHEVSQVRGPEEFCIRFDEKGFIKHLEEMISYTTIKDSQKNRWNGMLNDTLQSLTCKN